MQASPVAGLFDEVAWEDIVKVVQVNLLGVMIGVRAAIGLLKVTPGSLCLTTSSSSAIFGTAGIAHLFGHQARRARPDRGAVH